MLNIFILFQISQSCNNLCETCSLESVNFYRYHLFRNQCTLEIYSSYQYEDINCKGCILDSGILVDCDSAYAGLNKCQTSSTCAFKKYSYSALSLKVPTLQHSSICSWHIDFTNSNKNDQSLELKFSSNSIGKMIISAYNLPYGISVSSNTAKMVLIIDVGNYKSFEKTTLSSTNYVTIVYYTYNEDVTYAGFSLKWAQSGTGSEGELSKILTITALCLVSVFCMGCCGVLCRRLYKSARNTTRVYDQALTNFQGRARVYEELPENSVLYESDIQRMFPKELFREELLEVGEKVCCICLEE